MKLQIYGLLAIAVALVAADWEPCAHGEYESCAVWTTCCDHMKCIDEANGPVCRLPCEFGGKWCPRGTYCEDDFGYGNGPICR
ncbi:hypothetical protein TI39_contig5971g00001 [Zymoseptoria brevis]|uniref:Uncharacterized protein n=1 Tax=Zymoseptoria brevis TaxID=1047168 RepID=A0A0F4G3V8_9PEZI|nr:hypothetical protein TI39_contig5971g00001 [Zymoseptoria brevis]